MKSVCATPLGILLAMLLLPACGVGGGGTLTPTVAPAIPANVTALSGNKQVMLKWSSPSAGNSYTVKRSLTSGGPYFPVSVPGQFETPTTYVDSGLTNATDYYYVVSAANQFGQSQDSAEIRGTPGFTAIYLGVGCMAKHSLTVLQDRSLWAFGVNSWGQLGNGLNSGQTAFPVKVVGLDDVTAAAAGTDHSLALRGDGTVWAWGKNDLGQLGQGSPSSPLPLPTPVPGLDQIVSLTAGEFHNLALRNDGTVWAWGDNTSGQIGTGAAGGTPVSSPFQIPGLSGIRAIAAGRNYSLAVRADGLVWSWGINDKGQLGLGSASPTPVSSPAQVTNLTGVKSVAAGAEHSMAVRDDGSVWTWGGDTSLVLGLLTGQTFVPQPTKVNAVTQARSIAAGQYSSFAVRDDGTVLAWGGNGSGQLGLGHKNTPVGTPTVVPTLQSVTDIVGGWMHVLSLREDGTVQSWGGNVWGQLGNGLGDRHGAPTQVPNFTNVAAVAAGTTHSVALRGDGTVWTWGDNAKGQLGNGSVSNTPSSTLVQVPGLSGMTAVAASMHNSFAVKDDGSIWGWGDNGNGNLGQGSGSGIPTPSPVQVKNLTGFFTEVAPSASHVLALRNDGTVWGWGFNGGGALGQGSTTPSNSYTPLQVVGLSGITAIRSGQVHSIALKNDGTVWGWGYNTNGQVGSGAAVYTANPTVQEVLTGAVSISAGYELSLALKADGTVWGWGSRGAGQVGDGVVSSTPSLVPVQVPNFGSVVQVAAGTYHSLALKSDGTVWSWGGNAYGALGTGDETQRSIPGQVFNLLGPTAISAGDQHSLAIMQDKTLQGWGWNGYRQLGIPVVIEVLTPTTIQQ